MRNFAALIVAVVLSMSGPIRAEVTKAAPTTGANPSAECLSGEPLNLFLVTSAGVVVVPVKLATKRGTPTIGPVARHTKPERCGFGSPDVEATCSIANVCGRGQQTGAGCDSLVAQCTLAIAEQLV